MGVKNARGAVEREDSKIHPLGMTQPLQNHVLSRAVVTFSGLAQGWLC